MKKYIKIALGIILVAIVGTIYCAFWGNPVEYLIAKNSFEKYIDKHYKDKVEIDNITYNFKTNNFVAHIKDVEKTQKTSYLDYLGKYGIEDGYYYDTMFNMQDEINNYILYNIEKETGLFREYMSIDSSIDIEMYKYRIYDCYSGEEPITLDLQLHEVYDFEEKENKNYDKDKFPYKSEDEFLNDAYKIVKTLQEINYDFDSIKIYSYKEDGNNAYELSIDNLEQIKTKEDLGKIIKNVDYSKK